MRPYHAGCVEGVHHPKTGDDSGFGAHSDSIEAECAPDQRRQTAFFYAPLRYCEGSTGVAPLRISKWSCGDVTLPVCPDFAIT
jgi:hypothetical protein